MWLDDVSVAELKVAGEEEMTEGGNLLPRPSIECRIAELGHLQLVRKRLDTSRLGHFFSQVQTDSLHQTTIRFPRRLA